MQTLYNTSCPYEDCENSIIVPQDAEEADIVICRSKDNPSPLPGCNRNTEITLIERDNQGNIIRVELDTLEIDEDWGE